MNSTYKTSLEKLRNERLKALFQTLEVIFKSVEIDFYFLGAFAKDIWNSIYDLPSNRMTKDIDIAVLVPDKGKFEILCDLMIESGRFTGVKNNQVKFIFDQAVEIDIIPFGGYDIFQDKNLTDLVTYAMLPDSGFEVVYQQGLDAVDFDDVFQFKVCSLPSIVLLKFLAYENVPEYRVKDLKDIFHILTHYFDVADDTIYAEHLDLFDDENFDTIRVAARVMGRTMQPMLNQNKKIKAKVVGLLAEDEQLERMAIHMVAGSDIMVSTSQEWLYQLYLGILDDWQ